MLRWFERYPSCSCGKKATGILRGSRNESYGPHCTRCAKRRLQSAEVVRKRLLQDDQYA